MKRVGLIFGSRSVEHEISVTTASKAYEALRRLAAEYETVLLYVNKAGAWLSGKAVTRLLEIEAEGRACPEPARRKALGGFLPSRRAPTRKLKPPKWEDFAEFFAGSDGREVSTTMAFVRLLARLMRDASVGRFIVPIVPDEARTFGMEALFRQFGIYSSVLVASPIVMWLGVSREDLLPVKKEALDDGRP